jgi:hypothetical protein
VKFLETMEKEHKSKSRFTAPNYKIETCPSDEWRIVLNVDKNYERKYEGHQRRIPDYKQILTTDKAKAAGLTDVEVIAIILYTGPMVREINLAWKKFHGSLMFIFVIPVCHLQHGPPPMAKRTV